MKLAEYRPVVDAKHLFENLARVEQITDDAQRFFNNTRIRVVHYEDLVVDPKVGRLPLFLIQISSEFRGHSVK